MSLSSLAAEEEKLKRLKEYKEFKEILQKQLHDLQSEIKNLKSTLIPNKTKDEILNDPMKPHLKKRIMISDDDTAKKQAETLVSKLNKERKMKEMKKMKEIENMGKNLKGNIEQIKKERLDPEKQVKYEKRNIYLNRLQEVKAKREFLLKGNLNPLELLNQFKNTSELNDSLMKEKIKGSPDLLNKKKEELNKIRDLLKNK
jgi:hypothetical protein